MITVSLGILAMILSIIGFLLIVQSIRSEKLTRANWIGGFILIAASLLWLFIGLRLLYALVRLAG